MTKDKNNKSRIISLAIPLAVILICLVILSLYETGVIKRLRFNSAISLKTVNYSASELTSVTPDSFSQNLLLVNTEHPIDSAFEADTSFYRETDVVMNNAILEDYGRLSDYIRENLGDRLYVSSSYRSYEDQERVYNEEGPEIAALPGTSEHQTGLALDVYVMYFAGSAFIDSTTGRFVNDSCYDFGFIIRYPYGAEAITGFNYEPWHIRYVGFPHSEIIGRSGITLEEYIDSFTPGSWYSYGNYLISRQPEDSIMIPAEYSSNPIVYSPDNTGYVFVTISL